MQTQCPHCDTQFRITESQVNTANGFVRCGVCKEVFNAFEVASQDEQQHSLLEHETVEHELPEAEQEVIAADNFSAENNAEDSEILDLTNEVDKDEFDFFDEENITSQSSVVPEQFRDSTSSTNISTLLWSAGTLVLIASLFVEYTWFNRHQLNQVPELQTWVEQLCLQVDCHNISVRDPDNIELISRNVYSHPTDKTALMIAITIKNNAEFAQPFPVMQVDFSDIRGNIVAARRFKPREYLQIENEELNLIQSGSDISFSMEIVDPGKQAKTYEFNFL